MFNNLNRLFGKLNPEKKRDALAEIDPEAALQALIGGHLPAPNGATANVPVDGERVRMPTMKLNTARLFGGLGNSQERNQSSGDNLPASEIAPTINSAKLFNRFGIPEASPAPPINIAPDNLIPPPAVMPRTEGVGLNTLTAEDVQAAFAPNSIESPLAPPQLNTARLFNLKPSNSALTVPQSQQVQNQINDIQSKDYSKAVYDEQGNLVKAAGANRDKDWTLGDKVKSALIGVGEGLAQGGLLGAIGGGISAGTNRNFMEQRGDGQQLNKLFGSWKQAQEAEGFQTQQESKRVTNENIRHDNDRQDNQDKYKAGLDERNGLLRQLQLTKRYKRGENPEFDAKLEAAHIEQPDFEPGKKINPRYWNRDTGTQMTFDENGRSVPVLDAQGNPIVSEAEKNVSSNGYSVRPGAALNYDGQVEASRVTAGNQTAGNEREYKVGLAKIESKIKSSNTAISNANKRLTEIEGLTGIEKIKAVDEKRELLKQIREEQAELAGYEEEKNSLPAPVQVQARSGGGTVYTESQARDYYTKQGISAAEIEKRIQEGKTKGIIK